MFCSWANPPRQRRAEKGGCSTDGVRLATIARGDRLIDNGDGSGRLLIVDDHVRFRATARRMFESEGWTVIAEAHDGEGALHEADRVRPDVVLLDVGLPDASGIDIARVLCTRHPGLAVVLVSTRDADDYADLARSAGARGFIAKGELSGETLQRVLSG